MRYKNIFTGELVTKKGETFSHTLERKVIEYQRDNPLIGERGQKMYIFSKPDYVFNQTYELLDIRGQMQGAAIPLPPAQKQESYISKYL